MSQALRGLRILELGQLIAGPFAGSWLASFGADVIKVEPPGAGDPIRRWRRLHDGTSLWWRTLARNKRSVAIDLRTPVGQALVRRLVTEGGIDVVVENFRPGRLEAWGIGWEQLRALQPRLIMVRVSGWDRRARKRRNRAFANVAEAAGGLRYLTGEPGRPPVRAGISIGDSLAGMHAAFGLMTALYHRDVLGGPGQLVDVALQEAVFSVLESTLPEYDLQGFVRQRTGTSLPGIAPTNTYPCRPAEDGRDAWVVIGANSDAMFRRLMRAIGREDLAEDPELQTNDGRVERAESLDEAIAAWTRERSVDEALEALRDAAVASGPIQSIADLADDPQMVARGAIETCTLPDGTRVKMPAAAPRLSETPGESAWVGPELGQHTREVLRERLGLEDAELDALIDAGVIA